MNCSRSCGVTKMVNERKAPEVRFEGFAEMWEEQGLMDVLSPTVGNNTLSRADLNYAGGEVKNIHYGDILIKFGSFVDAVNDEIPFISGRSVADFRNNLLKDGDVIFADTAEDETTGKAIEITNATEVSIVSGLHTIVYRPKMRFANCFLGYYLNTNSYRQQLLPLMQGAKVLSLGRSHLATTLVRYPSTLSEQTIIADFFRNLDETIEAKKQQHEQTVNIKKSMLEKMFPKKGADVPEIRFEGFNEAWEVKHLSEVADIVGGGTPSTAIPEYWGGVIDWYSPVEIGANVYANSSQRTLTELGLSKCSATVLPANRTILFTSRAGIGDMAILTRDAATNQGFQSLIMKNGYDVYFTYSMGDKIKEYALRTASGSTFLEISGKLLGRMQILYPSSFEEQAIVGNFFRKLDELIEAQRQELEKLQNIKKACLSKMFV